MKNQKIQESPHAIEHWLRLQANEAIKRGSEWASRAEGQEIPDVVDLIDAALADPAEMFLVPSIVHSRETLGKDPAYVRSVALEKAAQFLRIAAVAHRETLNLKKEDGNS